MLLLYYRIGDISSKVKGCVNPGQSRRLAEAGSIDLNIISDIFDPLSSSLQVKTALKVFNMKLRDMQELDVSSITGNLLHGDTKQAVKKIQGAANDLLNAIPPELYKLALAMGQLKTHQDVWCVIKDTVLASARRLAKYVTFAFGGFTVSAVVMGVLVSADNRRKRRFI